MVNGSEQFRQSDVTFWGVFALVAGAFAVLSANISTLLPVHVLTGLHATRLEGANLNVLRAQLVQLRDETSQLRRESSRLATLLTLAEESRGDVTRRVGALESTLPVLIENLPSGTNVDRTAVTASITTPAETTEVEGGSVAIQRQPLFADPEDNTMPAALGPATQNDTTVAGPSADSEPLTTARVMTSDFAIAVGPDVTVQEAYVTWQDISRQIGALLIGLEPILTESAGGYRLAAGPLPQYTQAEALCTRVVRAGISCLPVTYSGAKMPD